MRHERSRERPHHDMRDGLPPWMGPLPTGRVVFAPSCRTAGALVATDARRATTPAKAA